MSEWVCEWVKWRKRMFLYGLICSRPWLIQPAIFDSSGHWICECIRNSCKCTYTAHRSFTHYWNIQMNIQMCKYEDLFTCNNVCLCLYADAMYIMKVNMIAWYVVVCGWSINVHLMIYRSIWNKRKTYQGNMGKYIVNVSS